MSQDLGKFLSETSRNYSLRKEAGAGRLAREVAKTLPGAVVGYGADSAAGGDGIYGAIAGGALGRKTRLGQALTRKALHGTNNAVRKGSQLVEKATSPGRDFISKAMGQSDEARAAMKAEALADIAQGAGKRRVAINKSYAGTDARHAQKGVKKDLASEMHDASRSAGRMEDKAMKAKGSDLHADAVARLTGQGMSSQKAGVVADKLLKKNYNNGAPSLMSNLKHAPGETLTKALPGAAKAAFNNPGKVGLGLAGGAATAAVVKRDAILDRLDEAAGGDPTGDRQRQEQFSKPSSEAEVDAELAPAPDKVGGSSPEDTAETESTMDKLSGYGKDVLGKIQAFANTRGGSAAIGGATGAGLAYLADKLMSDDDDDEDKARKSSLLATLIGAVGGAGIGMGVQHYMGKNAAEVTTKVQAAIRDEAEHMTDEDLEATVQRLEMREKTAAQTEYFYRRLKLNFSSNPIT